MWKWDSFRIGLLLVLIALPMREAVAGVAFTGSLGAQVFRNFKDMGFGYNFSAYYKFDEQMLLGVQTGQGIAGNASAIPLLGAIYARLPFGRVVMPVFTSECGYVLHNASSNILWRAGGLFDIRNGRHSSLLLGSEYEGQGNSRGGLVFRGGLLFEL
jgi:hypothetical protein